MDNERFNKGRKRRMSTLGEEYVRQSLDKADGLTRPFQEMMTEWCWGFGWDDDAIDPKTRSLMNLAMLGALGKMHEWEIHCRGAIRNGVTAKQIRASVHVVAIYAGVPASLECFRIARKVLEENGLLPLEGGTD